MSSTTIKSTATIRVNPPLPSIREYVHIRDHIVIDAKLKARLDKKLAGLDPFVTLIARVIEHAPGFELKMPGYFVRLIAARYDARGGSIDVGGAVGANGVSGAAGNWGVATHTFHRKGDPGGGGTTGGRGDSAGTIQLICEQLGDVRMLANGRAGGKGGAGGAGGPGADGLAQSPRFDGFEGSGGGAGGPGGGGGPGGAGGVIQIDFVSADNVQRISMNAASGAGGAAGERGRGGKKGKLSEEPDGAPGAAGNPGTVGAVGKAAASQISEEDYWKRVKAFGSSKTAAWADYRLEAGVYFYRLYSPGQAAETDMRKQAMGEFDATLQLRPGDAGATRFQQQILHDQNVLGLSLNLDLIPVFKEYFADYTTQAGLVTNFYNGSMAILLAADNKAVSEAELNSKVDTLTYQVKIDTDFKDAAQSAKDGAGKTLAHAQARINELSAQIQVAAAKKPDTDISIGSIISTVALVGGAVASVIAAIPTGGGSLIALVPTLAALTTDVTDISAHVFAATEAETTKMKEDYKKVGKNFEEVFKGAKSVINLVETINKLTVATSADNAEVAGLMRQGVEAAYEWLLANLHAEQADLTLKARELEVGRDNSLLTDAQNQLKTLTKDGKILKQSGHTAILATQRRADYLLTTAFKAARSVEIYALKNDESARIAFDSGYVHPDIEHDYADFGDYPDDPDVSFSIAELVDAYTTSWLKFLNPLDLLVDYTSYFQSDGQFNLLGGIATISITDKPSLDAFRSKNRVSFILVLEPPPPLDQLELPANQFHLPANQFEVKIGTVRTALIGAKSTKGGLNSLVRHGGRYLIQTRDGAKTDQLLEPQMSQPTAQFTTLLPAASPVSNGMGGEFGPDPFWGRGVAGEWEISVEPNDLIADKVDLSGLTEIQMWIATQSFVPKH